MIKGGMPVLIDFGSCQPFGKHLQSLGTKGWYEEIFFTSEKKHDVYSMEKLKEWFDQLEETSQRTEKGCTSHVPRSDPAI